MKEILFAFLIALVVGSIIRGSQEMPPAGTTDMEMQGGASAGEAAAALESVDDKNFQSAVLSSDVPVLVDFYADNCAACKTMAPVLAEISNERPNSLKVVRCDVMNNPSIAARYGIGPIPAFLLFKKGQRVVALTGSMPKNELLSKISSHLDTEPEQPSKTTEQQLQS